MIGPLQSRLGELAHAFSERVLEAIRGASLEELFAGSSGPRVAPKRAAPAAPARAAESTRRAPERAVPVAARRSGRLSRRSSGEIERVISEIVALLAEHPEGLRAEQIRKRLGLLAKELPRPLKEGLDSGLLGKAGQKRATTYFVAGTSRAAAPAAKASTGKAAAAGRKGRKAKKAAGAGKASARKAKRGSKKAKKVAK
jgi:hypothetical protein